MRRMNGMALVSVLITLAVVSALTVQTVKRQALQRELFAVELQQRQLWHQALGAEALAKQLLIADFKDVASKSSDRFGEVWDIGRRSPSDSVGPVLTIRDAQGKINLNSMLMDAGKIDPRRLQLFQQAASVDDVQPDVLSELAEWIDADDELRLGGRESNLWRRGGASAISVPDLPLSAIAEIRFMPSYEPKSYLPTDFWVALPESTKVNINTADAGVLQRLRPGITGAQLDAISRRQRSGGYNDTQAFLNASEGRGFQGIAELIDVRSSWFLLQVELEWEQGLLVFESLLHREPDSGDVRTQYRHWRAAVPTVRN